MKATPVTKKIVVRAIHLDRADKPKWTATTCLIAQAVTVAFGKKPRFCGYGTVFVRGNVYTLPAKSKALMAKFDAAMDDSLRPEKKSKMLAAIRAKLPVEFTVKLNA